LIKESCLLLTVRWNTLKPTYFVFAGEPIVLPPDVKAFKVNESLVQIGYLINELHADHVKEQVKLYQVGAVMPSIRTEDLLRVKIDLPALSQQRDRIRVVLEALAEEKKKELILFKRIHGLEAEITEQNTYLRHTLTTPSTNLKGSVINVKKILVDQVLPMLPDLMNFKVSDDHKISLGKYLEIIERDASKVSDAVGRQLKVDTEVEAMSCTPIDIISFLEEFVNEHNEQGKFIYTLSFDYDKEVFLYDTGEPKKTYILSNTNLLHDLFNNLISNAVAHAFITPDSDNRIEIYLSKSTDREVQVLFSNTGKPFPKPFTIDDFIRKGFSAGVKAGEGFGGWYVNELVKRMYGRLSLVEDLKIKHLSSSDLVTSFEMIIPITEADEEEI
jgi:type I restriction enzyme M protein